MGWLSDATRRISLDTVGPPRGQVGIISPWQEGQLTQIVWSDLFGTDLLLDRAQALSIPGVVRGRAILHSLIDDKQLVNYRDRQLLDPQPPWLYRSQYEATEMRMHKTLDDFIFSNASLWKVDRGAASDGAAVAPILDAFHWPRDRWYVDDVGRIVLIDLDSSERVPDEDEVILIPGPWPGLLSSGARTLRGAVALESAWIARANSPIPLVDLHETEESDMTRKERQTMVSDWNVARRDPNGATASTPFNVEAREMGQTDSQLYIEGRNASRLDVAAFLNLPGAILDASTATASLTYVTQQGTETSIYNITIPYWVRPIEARLSQDDVVPRGQAIAFDFTSLIATQPVPSNITPD